MRRKFKKILSVSILAVILNLPLSCALAVKVICKNDDGSYGTVSYPLTVWSTEERMYKGGVRSIVRIYVKDGRGHQHVYDRLLSFVPCDPKNLFLTIAEIHALANFVVCGAINIPSAFKIDSIDVFCANHNGFDYKIDIIDVVASPYASGFVKIPEVKFGQRYFSLSTYVSES